MSPSWLIQCVTSVRPNSLKSGFKKPGPNGLNVYRALLISGPPGIGKTTSAHLAAKLEGYTPIELNASDARSKKLVEVRLPWTLSSPQPDYGMSSPFIIRAVPISATHRWMDGCPERVVR